MSGFTAVQAYQSKARLWVRVAVTLCHPPAGCCSVSRYEQQCFLRKVLKSLFDKYLVELRFYHEIVVKSLGKKKKKQQLKINQEKQRQYA